MRVQTISVNHTYDKSFGQSYSLDVALRNRQRVWDNIGASKPEPNTVIKSAKPVAQKVGSVVRKAGRFAASIAAAAV